MDEGCSITNFQLDKTIGKKLMFLRFYSSDSNQGFLHVERLKTG